MTTIYVPEFETQRDQNAPVPWTNCTLAAGAMHVDWWTWGRKNTDDITLRRLSGVPVSQGVNFRTLMAAILKQYPDLSLRFSEKDGSGNSNKTWAWLRDHLATGGGSCVAGNYSSLAGVVNENGLQVTRWQPGGSFGHNIYFCDYRPDEDETVLLLDPLAKPEGYHGDRVPLVALWDFIWRNGNGPDARVTAAHSFGGIRPSPISDKDAALDRILNNRLPAVKKALAELENSIRWTRNLPD